VLADSRNPIPDTQKLYARLSIHDRRKRIDCEVGAVLKTERHGEEEDVLEKHKKWQIWYSTSNYKT
jgi:hypothetical protein